MNYRDINFMSYNSTGLDSVKCSWISDLLQTFDIQFGQIQEHFKANKSTESYFRKAFSSYESFIIPGYKEPFRDSGRPKGGLAQLARKNMDLKLEKNTYQKLANSVTDCPHRLLQNHMV